MTIRTIKAWLLHREKLYEDQKHGSRHTATDYLLEVFELDIYIAKLRLQEGEN